MLYPKNTAFLAINFFVFTNLKKMGFPPFIRRPKLCCCILAPSACCQDGNDVFSIEPWIEQHSHLVNLSHFSS